MMMMMVEVKSYATLASLFSCHVNLVATSASINGSLVPSSPILPYLFSTSCFDDN